MSRFGVRTRILFVAVMLLVAGVAWGIVSGIDIQSPTRVGANTWERIDVTVKDGGVPVPGAQVLVTTDYGWLQPGEVVPKKARIGDLKLLEDQTAQGDKVKRAVYTADPEGHVAFRFYGESADTGKEATVIIRELNGSFRTSFRIKMGSTTLVQGDPLPLCSPVLLDKQADAGEPSKPTFIFWVGFEDAAGNLIDVMDASAQVHCTLLTPGAKLVLPNIQMFNKYVAVMLEDVPASGASVYVELVGEKGMAAAGTLNTSDTPDPRGRNTSLWRD